MVGLPAEPEWRERLASTKVVRSQLQYRFTRQLEPELFTALDATIDQLDRRLDVTAGDGQAVATIRVIVHVAGIVRQINKRAMNTLRGVTWSGVFGWFAQACLVVGQFGNHLLDAALPNQLGPGGIDAAANRLGRGPDVAQRMDDVSDRRGAGKMVALNTPVCFGAVGDKRRSGSGRKVQLPSACFQLPAEFVR